MISSNGSATNWITGVLKWIGITPAVPPEVIGDFCLMFCAPASIVSRVDTPVALMSSVTSARYGSRRYFQFASGRKSAWLAVSAWLKLKSGIVLLLGV